MSNPFFALMSRMKYIDRWSLMRNTTRDDLSSHSFETASIAYALCVIGNRRLGKSYDAERACALALYHDAPEILTGDMPTPVKYYSEKMKKAYDEVESEACQKLLDSLPEDLREEYRHFFFKDENDAELWIIVKAADKLSALIKCIEERKAGNSEFSVAEESTRQSLDSMNSEEVKIFTEVFLPDYEKTLDQL